MFGRIGRKRTELVEMLDLAFHGGVVLGNFRRFQHLSKDIAMAFRPQSSSSRVKRGGERNYPGSVSLGTLAENKQRLLVEVPSREHQRRRCRSVQEVDYAPIRR